MQTILLVPILQEVNGHPIAEDTLRELTQSKKSHTAWYLMEKMHFFGKYITPIFVDE
ncbi:hypothetical protein [Flagellimonas sp.]|uniref:hypothetical protein n=1 Tax=Flagellimonas sp. TaxID=2058762 RepID=UPI003B5C640D